ncbi:hypothetical protein B0J11DRAFT_17772 [Dendryphion nanum]|uniref:Zn(2)-C6 fungal-type domain-containing protein n=1 Tax=Dendryphion nanum TaxID=256645 RepID=A0A9P9IWS0_9PLEO|nr:hypothetical protein B0J11DRAFT_17772 [Dendryphion nanum]
MSVPQGPKPPRLLSCILCQRRKVKCDRQFPCTYCTKSGVQCIPAAKNPRQRRRRFPERELLDQLKKYEDLLRQNNIVFESLHDDPLEAMKALEVGGLDDGNSAQSVSAETEATSPASTVDSKKPSSVDFWQAIHQRFGDADDSESSQEIFTAAVVMNAWDRTAASDDPLIFGSSQTTANLSSLHPEPAQIFRLWQIYLDNVNPLLKVVHSPTLQGRIVEAINDLDSASPALHALMFSIYAIAVLSLVSKQCKNIFGLTKDDALLKYQFACRQALLRSGFLRSSERDCLTALYLYMISVTTIVDPRALSSLVAVALRIAQRMQISSESGCVKTGVLEGEMRRRLWWALVLFDARVSELSDFKSPSLTPTWDCKVPLNLNDADLRPEMNISPHVHETPTESIFVVAHATLGDFIRNTDVHLNYTSPNLKPLAKFAEPGSVPEDGQICKLEKILEEKYLRLCNPEIPLHFITIWRIRALLSKAYLMEIYAKFASAGLSPLEADAELDVVVIHALRMVECDTRIMSSPISEPFRWMSHYNFPFPAYVHLVKDLRRRPFSKHADRAWETMSDNCDARIDSAFQENGPFFDLFSRIILHAWWAKETKCAQIGEVPVPPRIVSKLKGIREQKAQSGQVLSTSGQEFKLRANADVSDPAELSSINPIFSEQGFGDLSVELSLDIDMCQFGWPMMDWGFGQQHNT